MGRPLPTGLRPALEPALVREALAGKAQDLLGPPTRVRAVRGEILRRATIRYELVLAGAPLSTWRVIGKIYDTRTAGETAHAAQRWLWQRGFAARPPLEVTIPRVLAFLPELKLLLMEEAGGESLQRLLNDGRARPDDLRAFAQVLVKLHRFPFQHAAPFTLEQHLRVRCRGLHEPLARTFPDLSAPIARIVDTAREREDEALLASYTLAHGDYHAGQVHLDGGRHWLLDIDSLQRRDPAYDVAMVVVRLNGLGAKRGDEKPFRELLRAFLETYFSSMDSAIADRVMLNAALIFLKRACKRFCYQDERGWHAAVRFQVRRAAECLAGHERAGRTRDLSTVLELCAACPGAA